MIVMAIAACGPPAKPKSSEPVTPARLLGPRDFEQAGATVTKINATESLVCLHDHCVCMEELACEREAGGCFTLASNLAGFLAALARDTKQVFCELADTGRFCDLEYFRFEGDIYRWEVRYFGRDGRLVGQSNATDYPQYCGGKAMQKWTGRVPDCAMKPRDVEVICAEPRFRGKAGQLENPRTAWFPEM